uniref:Endonuclease/exonuclease/phosphatase domain-containing protein n=1 Tax=Anopheles arabiensis TaxID=7173 RepID=A0A182HYD2_ANOAR
MSSSILKVANWNANSILKKKLDLTNFLQKHIIDIILDRTEGQKGGVAIFIKNSIKHRIMKSLNFKVIEGIGINVETSSGNISFISAYHPGANKNMKAFANDVVTLTKLNSSYFICGDINARHRLWNCANSNEAGKVLNMIHRKWQRHRRCSSLKNKYNSLCYQINQKLEETRNNMWSKVLISMNIEQSNKNNIWKFVKIIKNKDKFMPPLKENNQTLLSPQEKAKVIKKHFETAHFTTYNSISPVERKVESKVRQFNSSNSSLPLDPGLICKTSEIKDLLKKIKNRKSPGLDNINNKTLKKLPPKALIFLNHIFNCCFKLGYYPK